MVRTPALAALAAIPLLLVSSATADEVRLSDGSSIQGTIGPMIGGTLTIDGGAAGKISVPFGAVSGLTTTGEHTIWIGEPTPLRGRFAVGSDGSTSIITSGGEVPIDYSTIESIDPPAEKRVTHTGNVALSAKSTEGNTKTQSVSANAEYVRRTKKDRFTSLADWNYTEDDGTVSQRNASIRGKYDYFFNDRFFAYGNGSLQGDEFQNLDLRTTLGAGAGYQFAENETYQYYEEAGVSYLNEDFSGGVQNDFATSRFSGKFDWVVMPERISFFHFHEVLWSLEDSQDVLVDSKTGFRFTLIADFFATIQLNLKWDNTPVPGNERTDTEYLLGLGYSFTF